MVYGGRKEELTHQFLDSIVVSIPACQIKRRSRETRVRFPVWEKSFATLFLLTTVFILFRIFFEIELFTDTCFNL